MTMDAVTTFLVVIAIMLFLAIAIFALVLYIQAEDKRFQGIKVWFSITGWINVILLTVFLLGYRDSAPLRMLALVLAGASMLASLFVSSARMLYEKGERELVHEKADLLVYKIMNGKGEKGEPGEQGPTGIGQRGRKGQTGPLGPRGERGDRGAKGEVGDQGERGDRGERGERGSEGEGYEH